MIALPLVLMTEEEVAALGHPGDAGFGALETARGRLPLAAMDVDARVTGVIAAIEVAQTLVNTTGSAIEATYVFPLPDRAAVHRSALGGRGSCDRGRRRRAGCRPRAVRAGDRRRSPRGRSPRRSGRACSRCASAT